MTFPETGIKPIAPYEVLEKMEEKTKDMVMARAPSPSTMVTATMESLPDLHYQPQPSPKRLNN